MEPSEALSTAAQIAVALAGFAGVVVAFRSRLLHEWSLLDRYRLWLLLSNALLPLFACLFGMLLLTIKPVPPAIWHCCSAFSLFLIVSFSWISRRRFLEVGPAVMKEMGPYRYVFFLIGILGVAVGFLQAYNALVAGLFWFFYAAVIFQLSLGVLQFARMILLPPHGGET